MYISSLYWFLQLNGIWQGCIKTDNTVEPHRQTRKKICCFHIGQTIIPMKMIDCKQVKGFVSSYE